MEITSCNIKLLDCTLRDGGSVMNHDFPQSTVLNITQGLNDADIDIIEAGFLDENKFDIDYFNKIFSQINNKKIKTAVMINFGHYDINKIKNKNKGYIDAVRLMFKKYQINDALSFASKLIDKGYQVSLNPVSVTTYDETDIKKLCLSAGSLMPEVVYIIDTYGLLDKDLTLKYLNLFETNLDKKIKIGFHAHNNRQLALSNSIEIIKNINREVIIDGSLYGMGKRAGNMPIELFADYMNYSYNKNYNIDIITNLIETEIIPLKEKYEWGYNLIHYIASINYCHSEYVMYLYKEKKLSINETSRLLKYLDENKKLTFDKEYTDKIYEEYK